jgi:hypothetical protein
MGRKAAPRKSCARAHENKAHVGPLPHAQHTAVSCAGGGVGPKLATRYHAAFFRSLPSSIRDTPTAQYL